jgi:hypothetical protein
MGHHAVISAPRAKPKSSLTVLAAFVFYDLAGRIALPLAVGSSRPMTLSMQGACEYVFGGVVSVTPLCSTRYSHQNATIAVGKRDWKPASSVAGSMTVSAEPFESMVGALELRLLFRRGGEEFWRPGNLRAFGGMICGSFCHGCAATDQSAGLCVARPATRTSLARASRQGRALLEIVDKDKQLTFGPSEFAPGRRELSGGRRLRLGWSFRQRCRTPVAGAPGRRQRNGA